MRVFESVLMNAELCAFCADRLELALVWDILYDVICHSGKVTGMLGNVPFVRPHYGLFCMRVV